MSDPINRRDIRPEFWAHVPLSKMTQTEWEALCDGCGKCCLNKLEDADTGEVFFTRVACRLLDDQSCQCGNYEIRKSLVPECVVLNYNALPDVSYWLPSTCAYRLLAEKKPLFDWHYLISGSRETVHEAGASIQGRTVPEFEIDEDDWEDYIVEDM